MRAERGERQRVCWDGDAVHERQLRGGPLLRERDVREPFRVHRGERDVQRGLHLGYELREWLLLQHHEPTVRAERGQWHRVCGDGDAVHERQLRRKRLLRQRELQRLRVRWRELRERVHGRRELRERLLLQYELASVRAERGERQPVRGDGGAVLERQLRGGYLLPVRNVRGVYVRQHRRHVQQRLQLRQPVRDGLLQYDVAAVRAERGERPDVRGDSGSMHERQLRGGPLLRERVVCEQFCVHRGERDVQHGLHLGYELRERHLLQHDVAPVRARRFERRDLFWDGGAVHERQLRWWSLLPGEHLQRLLLRSKRRDL